MIFNGRAERDLFCPKTSYTSWYGYLKLLITWHILLSPLKFEVSRVDCIVFLHFDELGPCVYIKLEKDVTGPWISMS